MAFTAQELLTDPGLFLLEFDETSAHILQMTRDNFHRSIFLDGRIRHKAQGAMRVPLDQLVQLVGNATFDTNHGRAATGWIFHVAQCGSTLLARALDQIGRSLVLREPAALRRIGVRAGQPGGLGDDDKALLRAIAFMLSKRWDRETPVIVKANVPVNLIADELMRMRPDAPAITLHFPLINYVAAILRTPGHVDWTDRVSQELRLAGNPICEGNNPQCAAEFAAALWFVQIKAFEQVLSYPNTASLEASRLFDDPVPVLVAAAKLFGVELSESEAVSLVSGELFHSYSKNPALDYDPEVRIAREAEAIDRLAPEIARARAWVERAADRFGLPDSLSKPLTGGAAPLL
ncbi:hypothetical protein [Tsuneonella mangrovi]|uniref:hypothetical protein n=1 Tax=Tsuneonella mangrovi TaxID=1982042 RepID=UPI0012375F23|nr:hypothetical protein [Tsuneonella mangrovi]